MQCTVLLFAQIADALGVDHLDVELADGATVADLVDQLATRHDAIGVIRAQLAVAVNEAYARPDTTLSEADTIALIPPVSGG